MASGEFQHALWSMAAVSRRTGIGQHTLRAWERRFGVPKPLRLPSGHRRYTDEQIEHLGLVVQALALGHRAGDVVPLSPQRLQSLVNGGRARAVPEPAWETQVLDRARGFDREGIVSSLSQACARLGVRVFLRDRLVPLTVALGEAWAAGRLAIAHEHFLTEILEDTLRGLRSPLEHSARGRPVLLTTLPGERHALGVQMAALTTALAGRRVQVLGIETPVDEIGAAAAALDAVGVGVSVSASADPREVVPALASLRRAVPERTRVWVGGCGASALTRLRPAVTPVATLQELEAELEGLARHDGSRPFAA